MNKRLIVNNKSNKIIMRIRGNSVEEDRIVERAQRINTSIERVMTKSSQRLTSQMTY